MLPVRQPAPLVAPQDRCGAAAGGTRPGTGVLPRIGRYRRSNSEMFARRANDCCDASRMKDWNDRRETASA